MSLDPQAKQFLAALEASQAPAWEDMSIEEGREAFAGLTDLFGTGPAVDRVEDAQTSQGVRFRIYQNHFAAEAPAVIYYHGGGWVLGNLETHDALCRMLADQSGCTVISVDYRRPPEAPYPAAIDDSYDVARYVAERAQHLNVNSEVIVVAGDSAGGNLAAAVALRARDEQGPRLAGQLLVYPVIDRDFNTGSYQAFAEGYGLKRSSMQWFWQQYLGDRTPGPYAAPIRAESLAGLPPAHIILAEFDILHDEGAAYAKRLVEAGVPTKVQQYDGLIHGFFHFCGMFDVGKRAVADAAAVLRGFAG